MKIKFFKALRYFFSKLKINYLHYLMSTLIISTIKKKLSKEFSSEYNDSKFYNESIKANKTVWVCWFQGENRAPEIVKHCIKSIRKNIPYDYKIVILDDENIHEYIKFPEHILNKYYNGQISKTHFSDILRFSLLANYGGMWIDSTVYLTKNITPYIKGDFFTLKYNPNKLECFVSNGRWMGYFIKCEKGYQPVINMRNILYHYWIKNSELVDYFLIDYVIDYVYDNNLNFREDLNKLPNYGDDVYCILNVADKSDGLFNVESLPGVGIYKLSYKVSEEKKDRLLEILQGISN